MSEARRSWPPEFRRQMIALVRAGRDPEDLAREFEPTGQPNRTWVAQAAARIASFSYSEGFYNQVRQHSTSAATHLSPTSRSISKASTWTRNYPSPQTVHENGQSQSQRFVDKVAQARFVVFLVLELAADGAGTGGENDSHAEYVF